MRRKLMGLVLVLAVAAGVVVFAFPSVLVSLNIVWERYLAGLSEQTVQAGDDTIVYLEGGQGENVLLVHGFGADKDNWTRFARFLTPRYHVVALDLPGFGESTRDQAKRYDIESQAARVHRFVEALGLKRFHMAGNSMGGQISGVYTATFPEEVASLGLFAPGGLQSGRPSELTSMLALGKNPLLIDSAEDFDRLLGFIFVEPPYIPGPLKGYFAERAVRFRPFNEKVWRDVMEPRVPLEPYLSRIRARSLILWGDTDRVLDPSGVTILQAALDHPVTVLMKSCGHAPMIERPQETAEHYLKFLTGA